MKKLIILIISILLISSIGCNKTSRTAFQVDKYLIISADESLFSKYITLKSYSEDGYLVDEKTVEAPYAWTTELLEQHIAIVGTDNVVVLDYETGQLFEIEAESSVKHISIKDDLVAFAVNIGLEKDSNKYTSQTCVLKHNGKEIYNQEDYNCVESEYVPYDLSFYEDQILTLMSDFYTEEEYIISYDDNLNILSKEIIPTTSDSILVSNENEVIISSGLEYYYLNEGIKVESETYTNNFTYVTTAPDCFLRTNYIQESTGLFTEINIEKIDDNYQISEEKILPINNENVSVGYNSNCNVISIYEKDQENGIYKFYDLSSRKFIDEFTYKPKDNENVIGVYCLN